MHHQDNALPDSCSPGSHVNFCCRSSSFVRSMGTVDRSGHGCSSRDEGEWRLLAAGSERKFAGLKVPKDSETSWSEGFLAQLQRYGRPGTGRSFGCHILTWWRSGDFAHRLVFFPRRAAESAVLPDKLQAPEESRRQAM